MCVRWKRSMLWIGLVVTLLVSMAPIITVSSGDGAMLSLDINDTGEVSVVDPSYGPGSIFYVDFYIDDVVAMWGYDFWVWYNTSVLTATYFEPVAPFTVPQGPGGEINDTAGYVALRYSYPMGEPNGLTTTTPVWIAWIEFTVDNWGWSTLQLYGPPPENASKIVDIYGSSISHDVVTGFFANVVDFPHDIAVTAVEVSPTRNIIPGEFVSINVTVANQAPFNENFTVTVYANTTVVDSENITLAQLKSNTTQFDWDTTGFPFGHYNIRAEASVVPNETETANNLLIFDDIVIVGTHDIAVTNVTVTSTNVVFGEPAYINVTVTNEGNFTETFNVTTKYGYTPPVPPGAPPETIIETKAVTSLGAGTSTTLAFTWYSSDVIFSNGVTDLWIMANVSEAGEPAVPYETNTANNQLQMVGYVTVWTEPATLKAPVVVDGSLAPGQTFSMNITIANVDKMSAYGFFLYYNNTVLNASSLTSYSPFTKQVQSTINNTEGWIYMNYTTPNATIWLSTVNPQPIARIDFNVTDWGVSPLDLRDPKIMDVQGRNVVLVIVDGEFRNFLLPHDISVSLDTPSWIYLGDSSLLNVTVNNYGLSNETNVELQLIINGTVEDSVVISELLSQTSYSWSYLWTPSIEGVYNITAYAPPVVDEQYTVNNNVTGTIRVQLIEPTASFTVSPDILLAGGIVTFDASASYSEDSSITSYTWDFGDGNVTDVTTAVIGHIYAENGTYTVSLNVTDDRGISSVYERLVTVYKRDIGIVSVVPSLTRIATGESVSISVTVVNQGDYGAETFNVTAYYGTTAIDTLTVTNLALGASQILIFDWDTTGVSPGTYTVKAVTSAVSGEILTDDNTYTFDGTVAVLIRDIAVTKVTASPENVTTGDIISINVTVVNQGDYGAETFNVTAYYGTTAIDTLTVTNLALGASQTLTFTWNTTGVTPGTYTVKAVASVVADEFDTGDNVRTVEVTVGEEGVVAGQDYTLYILAAAVLVIVLATLVYVLKIRKPKTP